MKAEKRLLTVHIQRFQPGDVKPRMQTFQVEASSTNRLVDVLRKIKEEQDDTLTWRSSCEHGICGSDGVNVNGRNTLACQVLVGNLPDAITIKPLPGLKVVKDLVNDQSQLFEKYKLVKPWLIPKADPPAQNQERIQMPAEYELYEPFARCILCFCCSSACPSTKRGDELTPAIIMAGLKQCLDSRDGGLEERRAILQSETGTDRCRTYFECSAACPKEIPVAEAIARAKRL
ncbi:MAG: succinate dehydrogenase iron-sulfur subunit [Planctomycetes bacterium]|nr:succinate dehydrogenase iron-sulfur subunit [Planctomycetota bacterium]